MKSGMRFSVLASGSSGNVCYVETGATRILIDAGLSCRDTVTRLERLTIRPETLDAIIITHEHADHIKGAGPVSRRFNLPLFLNQKTLERGNRVLGKLSRPVLFETGQTVKVKDIEIETFTKCHDAADPFGVVISHNGCRIALATDFGRTTRLMEDRLKKCQALIIEFNYDQGLLENGPYPLELKRRIKGPEGHLSNQQAKDLIKAVFHEDLAVVVLAHLSEINNQPAIAHKEAAKALCNCGPNGVQIFVSQQDEPVPMIEL